MKTGKEHRVATDLRDALFHLDAEVRVVFTDFPGVLLVSGKFNPLIARETIAEYNIKDVLKIRPFLEITNVNEVDKICMLIHKLTKGMDEIGLKIHIRGKYVEKEKLKKTIFDCFRKIGIRISFKATNFLVVDIIGDIIGFSLVSKGNA